MRPGTTPHYVSPLLPFKSGIDNGAGDALTAGVSKDGLIAWTVRESVLEVVDTDTAQCLALWKFGEVIRDNHTYITCVKEYRYGSTVKLLVGVCNASESGILCVLDVGFSRVVKAIEVPHKISAVEPVTSVGGDAAPTWALNAQLRHFHGIVSVGTNSGVVYLLDMRLDDQNDSSDEITPNKLMFITPRSRDTAQRRNESVSRNQHLCMVLDEEAQGSGYRYRKCDGEIIKTFNAEEVHVSCLKYIPQTGSLAVGFSFGCYQLWKLHIPVLEYSSRYENSVVPITHMTYQEPENDPKNFSYLWAARSTGDQEDDSLASISMYQLAYNKQTWYSNYGAYYEDLTSVSLRFDLDLVASPLNHSLKVTGTSRILSCYTLEDPCYVPPSRLNEDESFEEAVHGPDLSLCVFVWECSDNASPQRSCHMGVFDMNRWYHAQMPTTVRSMSGVMDTCPYFSFLSLDEIVDKSFPDNLLAVHVLVDRLRKFVNTSPMPPEQHFYPSALAFDTVVIMDSGIVKAHYLGTQRQVIASMQKMGPSVLLNPRELYNLCVFVGLLPRSLDVASHNPTPNVMRESLLSMALDHNMRSFIVKCILEWAPGEYVHMGCTLKALLDWVWDKVAQVKDIIDTTCVCLFDWSGLTLDQRGLKNLHQSNQRLSNIISIIKSLIEQSTTTTEQGYVDLHDKLSVSTLLQQHLQMIMLFVSVGLLPENDETADLQEHQYSYPAGDLMQAYKLRRQELQRINSDIRMTDLLMIDGLVEEMGPSVKALWSREGGNGLYPPPSLHALLSIYLLEDVDLLAKHSLVLYALLDLVSLSTTKHEQFAEKVQKFTKTFAIPLTVIKQVQGFWLLDHKDFEESVSVLLDPLITGDMGVWQHSRIIKSFLYQDRSKMAVRYLNTRQPSLSTLQEVKLKLTVLLANGLTAQALEFVRSCRDQSNVQDIMYELFMGCRQSKTINQLLQLPLTEVEEKCLAKFLSESCDPQLLELLVLHYLQKARYVEAIQLNEKLKQTVMTDTSSKARERAAVRNALVDGFKCVLPEVQRRLIFENINLPKRTSTRRKEVRRPQPLSTIVTKRNNNNIQSKASLYTEVVDKVYEINVPEVQDESKPDITTAAAVNTLLGTPITPAIKAFIQSQPVVYQSVKKAESSPQTPWKPPNLTNISTLTSSKYGSPMPSIRKAKFLGADALTLLQTPVINRKTPRKSLPTSRVATPQSILKVRSCVKSIISPSSQPSSVDNSIQENEDVSQMSSSVRTLPKRLGFNESSLPTTPRSVSFAKDSSAVNSPKQLRFMEADSSNSCTPKQLRFTNIKVPPSSPKIQLSPGSPRSVKDRSPTPESISRSPKNVSKLDKVTRSPQQTEEKHVAMETENENENQVEVTQQVDDDITFLFDKSHTGKQEKSEEMDTSQDTVPLITVSKEPATVKSAHQEEITLNTTAKEEISSTTDVLEPMSVNRQKPKPGSDTPSVHSSKMFQQFRASPILGSPKKLLGSQKTPRSPTVKLSSGKYTPKFADAKEEEKEDMEKVSKEAVSTTTNFDTSIEIDLTMDEDVDQEADHTEMNKTDNGGEVDVKPVFSFAPPVSTSFTEADRKDFSKLRAKPHFTFSPPVHIPASDRIKSENSNQSSSLGSSFTEVKGESVITEKQTKNEDVSPVSERQGRRRKKSDLSPEVKDILVASPVSPRRSLRIYNSLAGSNVVEVVTPVGMPRQKTTVVFNSLVGSEKEVKVEIPKIRKASLKSPKFKFSLKSPQSAQKLARKGSSSDRVTGTRTPKSPSKSLKTSGDTPGSTKDKQKVKEEQKKTKEEDAENLSVPATKRRRGSFNTSVVEETVEKPSPRKGRSPGRGRKKAVKPEEDHESEVTTIERSPGRKSTHSSPVVKSPGQQKKQSISENKDESVESTTKRSSGRTRKTSQLDQDKSPGGHEIMTRSRSRSLSPEKQASEEVKAESPEKSNTVGKRGRPRKSTPRKVPTKTRSSLVQPQEEVIPEVDDVPSEVPKSPGRTRAAPSEVPKSPGRTRAATRSVSEKPETVEKDEYEQADISSEVPKSLGRTRAAPSKVPKSPGRTRASPSEIQKSPGRTRATPSEVPKSPGRTRAATRSVSEKTDTVEKDEHEQALVKSEHHGEEVSARITKSPSRRKATSKSRSKKEETEVTDTHKNTQVTEESQSLLVTSLPPSPPTSDKSSPVQQVSTPRRRTRGTTPILTPTRRSSRHHKEGIAKSVVKEEDVVKSVVKEEDIVKSVVKEQDTDQTSVPNVKDVPAPELIQETSVPSPSSFEFAEPMQVDMAEIDSEPGSPEQFVELKSFVFSPPLTRGLSKRTSIEPDGRTSISKRLSIESGMSISRLKGRRSSQDENQILKDSTELPSSKLYDLDIMPRPPLHREKIDSKSEDMPSDEQVSRSRRGRRPRSHTPESQGKSFDEPDRAESEPPSEPTKEKVKRKTKKKESEDLLVLISPIKEEEGEGAPVRQTRQRRKDVTIQATTRQRTRGRGKRVAKLW